MATGAAIVTVASTAISLYGNHKRSSAEQEAMEARAASKRLQADQLIERFKMNEEALRVEGKQFVGIQAGRYAKGGVDVGSGSPVLAAESTYQLMLDQIDIESQEAYDKAALLYAGSDVDLQLKGDIRSAEQISNVGTFLRGASSTYSTYKTAGGK